MNAKTTFAQDLKKLMDGFDKAHGAWVKKHGTNMGFKEWFIKNCLERA